MTMKYICQENTAGISFIEAYLKQSGFTVEIYHDEEVKEDLMKTISSYSFVYMATHGCVGLMGPEVMTGEVANTSTIALFWNILKAGRTSGLIIDPLC